MYMDMDASSQHGVPAIVVKCARIVVHMWFLLQMKEEWLPALQRGVDLAR
jgi:hypothetical protein